MNRDPLVIALVPVIRPLFKGASPRAAEEALAGLRALGAADGPSGGFEVRTVRVGSPAVHAATGERVPDWAVTDAAEAERAAQGVEALRPDLLLVLHATFATGDLLAPLLRAAPRRGLWALPESAGGRGDTGPLPLNSLCGLNMALSFLDAPEVAAPGPVKWFHGTADDPRFRSRLAATIPALRALRALSRARVLHVGGTAPGFYGLAEEPTLPGAVVERVELAALFEAVAAVPAAEAAALARDLAAEPSDVTVEQLERVARIELGLARLAAGGPGGGYDALAVRCWPELPDACGSMACAAMGDSAEKRVPAACEGDVMGALSMLALQAASDRPAILMDVSDVRGDEVLMWHCGNAPASWAPSERATRLGTHFNRDGVGVVRDMPLRPGPATGFRLADGGRAAAVVGGVFGDPARAGFDGVRGWFGDLSWGRTRVGADGFLASLLGHRLAHHLAFGDGDLLEPLHELCAWLGAEVLPPLPASAALQPVAAARRAP